MLAPLIDTTDIHEYGTREYVACVLDVLEDGTLLVEYENGKRGRAQANGLGTETLRSFLVDLFQDIEDELGAPYVVMQTTDEKSVVWVPDGDGTLHRLRALLLEAGVLTPEVL